MDEAFDNRPHPDYPGWHRWALDADRFNDTLGLLLVRREDNGHARVRMARPERQHSNLSDMVHGGVLMAFADCALFAGAKVCGVANTDRAQTIECSMQFLGPARLAISLDAVVELLRETGRLAFLRGTIEQEGALVAAFSGTLRKGSAPR